MIQNPDDQIFSHGKLFKARRGRGGIRIRVQKFSYSFEKNFKNEKKPIKKMNFWGYEGVQ